MRLSNPLLGECTSNILDLLHPLFARLETLFYTSRRSRWLLPGPSKSRPITPRNLLDRLSKRAVKIGHPTPPHLKVSPLHMILPKKSACAEIAWIQIIPLVCFVLGGARGGRNPTEGGPLCQLKLLVPRPRGRNTQGIQAPGGPLPAGVDVLPKAQVPAACGHTSRSPSPT